MNKMQNNLDKQANHISMNQMRKIITVLVKLIIKRELRQNLIVIEVRIIGIKLMI